MIEPNSKLIVRTRKGKKFVFSVIGIDPEGRKLTIELLESGGLFFVVISSHRLLLYPRVLQYHLQKAIEGGQKGGFVIIPSCALPSLK